MFALQVYIIYIDKGTFIPLKELALLIITVFPWMNATLRMYDLKQYTDYVLKVL